MAQDQHLTGRERFFPEEDVIVTKTDRSGKITYANDIFLSISSLTERQALGAPHSIIRHPHMPGCVFRLLWDTVQSGGEIFAYVLNRATTGDHYWVFAHVTPTYDGSGTVTGYHSSRRVPDPGIVAGTIAPLYRELLEIERQGATRAKGIEAGLGRLDAMLKDRGLDYERFVFSLQA
ncbi:MAG TPA: PAS domain-containing protein [Azospirillaceae bacterium]|nr:PAS domain-containing protein [Azospirillaceae bacterium]